MPVYLAWSFLMGCVRSFLPLLLPLLILVAPAASAATIEEVLVPPAVPGSAFSGTFLITPSDSVWAFGVGNDSIVDTSISGIRFIDGLPAGDHWVSTLIPRSGGGGWEDGYDFDAISPIDATPPSSFSIDTSMVPWQWGTHSYVAFYWLSEAGPDPDNPLAVLQAGTQYDAFRFFTSGPDSPFATFSAADGGEIAVGETIVTVVPEPSTVFFCGAVLLLGTLRRRRGRRRPW
jgi:hypothetical protein